MQCGRPGFDPWIEKIPQRRERLPTAVFWPREFHGLYSPWSRKESDTTNNSHFNFSFLSKGDTGILKDTESHRSPSFRARWGDPPTCAHITMTAHDLPTQAHLGNKHQISSVLCRFLGLGAGLLVKGCVNGGVQTHNRKDSR